MDKFNFKDIENKYKNAWIQEKVFEAVDFSPKPKKFHFLKKIF